MYDKLKLKMLRETLRRYVYVWEESVFFRDMMLCHVPKKQTANYQNRSSRNRRGVYGIDADNSEQWQARINVVMNF